MKKYLCITSIILGLFADIMLLYGLYNFKSAPIIGLSDFSFMLEELLDWLMSSSPNFFMTFIGAIGFSLSIMDLTNMDLTNMDLTKYKTSNKKFLSIIGLILNFIPAFLFLILLFTIFIPLVLMFIFTII